MKKLLLTLSILFCLTANAQYTKLLDFNVVTNGSNPQSNLVSDGTFLYGTSSIGGASSCGTIFRIKPDGTRDTTLFTFSGGNGKNPQGSLYYDGAFLYGITANGGANLYGTLFKIKTDGTGFTTLINFANDTVHGCYPSGGVISDGTFLYGSSATGGLTDNGTIYKIKPDGTGYTKLYDFMGISNGVYPAGAFYNDGTFFYGSTMQGGTNNQGTIYKIKPDGTGYTVLYSFSGIESSYTAIGTFISDGTFLYGAQGYDGTSNKGRIFRIKPDGSGDTTLFSFANTYGTYPTGSLVSDGTYFYGMALSGGTNNNGVIFKIKPDGTSYTKLLDFSSATTGNQPIGSLMLSGPFLYGTAQLGGANNDGVIFKFNTACTPVTFTQSPTICAGHSITVGTNTYTTSGTYTTVIPNGTSTGCDSTVITNLTVLPLNTFTQTPTICSGQTLSVGTSTYTTTGTYTDVVSSVVTGCDSTITTHLTVLSAASSTSNTISICSGQSVNVGTDVYTSSGTYTFTYNGGACDSTIITNLTVNPTPTITINSNNLCANNNNGTTLTTNGATSYTWSTGSLYDTTMVHPTTTATYSVIGTLGTCTASATTTVTVTHVTVNFGVLYLTCQCPGVGFVDSSHVSAGDSIVAWNWVFTGGMPATSNQQNPSGLVIFGQGYHVVCLTIRTANGCTDSICKNVYEPTGGINKYENSLDLNIYPNPAKDILNVELEMLNGKAELKLYDVNGKQVLWQTINGKTIVDVSSLANGVYNISVSNSEGVANKKLIIVK
jgi:uncharacterized repeat protein (TIGR03803 family)